MQVNNDLPPQMRYHGIYRDYCAYDDGEVHSIYRNDPIVGSVRSNRMVLHLKHNNRTITIERGRFVYECFYGTDYGHDYVIEHIDGDMYNNELSNLRAVKSMAYKYGKYIDSTGLEYASLPGDIIGLRLYRTDPFIWCRYYYSPSRDTFYRRYDEALSVPYRDMDGTYLHFHEHLYYPVILKNDSLWIPEAHHYLSRSSLHDYISSHFGIDYSVSAIWNGHHVECYLVENRDHRGIQVKIINPLVLRDRLGINITTETIGRLQLLPTTMSIDDIYRNAYGL